MFIYIILIFNCIQFTSCLLIFIVDKLAITHQVHDESQRSLQFIKIKDWKPFYIENNNLYCNTNLIVINNHEIDKIKKNIKTN